MATTTNYSWTTPDDTDLVKDGAAAIRTLGSSIDTTVFNNASAAIAKSIVDAKGDLISATAADTPARLAVGTDGQVLAANSSTATGLEWQTISSGGFTTIASGSFNTAASTLTISSIPATYRDIRLILKDVSFTGVDGSLRVRINADGSSIYHSLLTWPAETTAANDASIFLGIIDQTATNATSFLDFHDYADTTAHKLFAGQHMGLASDATNYYIRSINGGYRSTNAISSLQIYENASNNFAAGTYLLLGLK